MTDRLQTMINRLQQLPPQELEEVADRIEELLEQLERRVPARKIRQSTSSWRDLIGSWSGDDVDEMFTEMDRIRHANPPSPPLEMP